MGYSDSEPTETDRRDFFSIPCLLAEGRFRCKQNVASLFVMLTLKSSMVTASEFRRSASMLSSSRSISIIFLRMAWRAASEHRAAKSAPTWPWVSVEICQTQKVYKRCDRAFTLDISLLLPVPDPRRPTVSCFWCESVKSPACPWSQECQCQSHGQTDLRRGATKLLTLTASICSNALNISCWNFCSFA